MAVGAGREANSCLTSSQSEAWLWLTKTAGLGRAPLPHSSFEALVEMCRLLCLHSAAGCRWSRVVFLITYLRLFVDFHPLALPQSAWSCSLSPGFQRPVVEGDPLRSNKRSGTIIYGCVLQIVFHFTANVPKPQFAVSPNSASSRSSPPENRTLRFRVLVSSARHLSK